MKDLLGIKREVLSEEEEEGPKGILLLTDFSFLKEEVSFRDSMAELNSDELAGPNSSLVLAEGADEELVSDFNEFKRVVSNFLTKGFSALQTFLEKDYRVISPQELLVIFILHEREDLVSMLLAVMKDNDFLNDPPEDVRYLFERRCGL